MAKNILIVLIMAVFVLSLAGCGTVQGLGSDIQWVGEKSAELIEGE